MAVDHEVDTIAVLLSAHVVGELCDADQIAARVERDTVLPRKPLAGDYLRGDGLERGVEQEKVTH